MVSKQYVKQQDAQTLFNQIEASRHMIGFELLISACTNNIQCSFEWAIPAGEDPTGFYCNNGVCDLCKQLTFIVSI